MIDWFTVVAQIVNFLILVGLLKYFLYGRVVQAMQDREQAVRARWDQAQQQREEAERELQAARGKNRQLENEREELLAKVRDEVEQYRQELTEKVRSDVDEQRARWGEAIQTETEAFLRDLRRRVSDEVCSVARRVLTDLADENLERRMVEQFLRRIEQLPDSERQAVDASLHGGQQAIIVQTSHPLNDELQQRITTSLESAFAGTPRLEFEQTDDLICGIALQTNSHKLAWDLRDYLASLEQELQQMLEEEATSKAPRQAEATTRES